MLSWKKNFENNHTTPSFSPIEEFSLAKPKNIYKTHKMYENPADTSAKNKKYLLGCLQSEFFFCWVFYL